MEFSLILGDCFERMKELGDGTVDCILTDLPYGMTSMAWDCKIPLDKLWEEYDRILKPNGNVILFGSGLFTYQLIQSNIKNFKYKMIWKKNVPTGMSSAKYRPMKYYEEILLFNKGKGTYNPIPKLRVGEKKECYKYNHYCGNNNHLQLDKKPKKYDLNFVNPSDILEFNVVPNRRGKLHPTQKPVELIEYLIKTYSNEGDYVLDNFMGSGTTAIACINTNRNFIGIETDKKYYKVSEKRINEHIENIIKENGGTE